MLCRSEDSYKRMRSGLSRQEMGCSVNCSYVSSPLYLSIRMMRLELVLLGFMGNEAKLQTLKRGLVYSNTRGVSRDDDGQWVAGYPSVLPVLSRHGASRLVRRRDSSGYTHELAGCILVGWRGHLAALGPMPRHGARLACVGGDQASYLHVLIPTGCLLADIVQSLGYEVAGVDLFRTRQATATKVYRREEVVVRRGRGSLEPRRNTGRDASRQRG